jgi:hypothetical protein
MFVMRCIYSLALSFVVVWANSQSSSGSDLLAGNYSANYNNDNLYLSLEQTSGSSYSGVMEDSYQTYKVDLRLAGSNVSGTAIESSMDLHFEVAGKVKGDQLSLSFTIDVLGEKKTMDVVFMRQGSPSSALNLDDPNVAKLSLPSGANHPQEVCGAWIKEEFYNSGSGDSFMGAGFSQTLTLLPDGRIAEGASSSYMSGSNYSGHSSGQGSGIIPGLAWYTMGNKFFLQITENGQLQTVPLGTYYVEGSNMLITATNGEKLLLTRK